jgi:hypothetical protein
VDIFQKLLLIVLIIVILKKRELYRLFIQNVQISNILKLNSNILEFENILIKCQYLDRLVIVGPFVCDWKRFFEILARSSPTSLFKFKI